MKLAVILEKGDRELWGRIENIGRFMPVVAGESKQIVWERLIDLIKDYQANEGRDDKAWKKYPVDKISFSFLYDLQSFFADHAYLNQSKIAELSGINSGLLRQYTSGVKHLSATQALKIQKVIHRLAKELGAVNFYV